MSELGSGSGTSYPASLDVDNSVEVDSSTTARADVPNDLAAAIIAVQTELGTDPAGSLTNVKTFLQTEHSANGTHGDLTVGSLTLSKSLRLKQGADVASASDLAIDIDGNLFDVTGTTTINTMKTKGIGTIVVLQFDGACQLTHDATNFFIPGKANYTTAAGDVFIFYEYASADWRCTGYALANGKAISETSGASSATTSAEGLVELATQAEVNTGTDTARSITPATLDGFINGKTDTTVTASDSIVFADATDSNKAKKDTVQGIIDLLSTAIDQGDLDTTTGDVTVANPNGSGLQRGATIATGPGGEYGFWPTVKVTGGGSGNTDAGCAPYLVDVGDSTTFGATLANKFSLTISNNDGFSVATLTARQRYVQASPPYDIGDGECHSFIFLLVDNSTGQVVSGYHAPDPVWANNGPTCIHPEYKRNGKGYRTKKIVDKSKAFEDPSRFTVVEQEITKEFKNSDMALLPHPWSGNDLSDKSIVLIDPCDSIVRQAESMKESGEGALDELFHKDYVRFGNEHIIGRCTPCNHGVDEVMVVKPKWKNSN